MKTPIMTLAYAILISSICLAGSEALAQCSFNLTDTVQPWGDASGDDLSPFDAAAMQGSVSDCNNAFCGVFHNGGRVGSRLKTGRVAGRVASMGAGRNCDTGCCPTSDCGDCGIGDDYFVDSYDDCCDDDCYDDNGRCFGGKRGQRANGSQGQGRYISGAIGVNLWEDNATIGGPNSNRRQFDIDDSEVYRVAVGRRRGCNMRTEIAGIYRRQELTNEGDAGASQMGNAFIANGSRNSTAIMYNVIRDFNRCGTVQPFVKAGVGASYNRTSGSSIASGPNIPTTQSNYPENDSTRFAWSAGGGFAMPINCRMTMDIEYQYLDFGDADTGPNGDGERLTFGGTGHEVSVGFRMNF